jgi:hypothetical protein
MRLKLLEQSYPPTGATRKTKAEKLNPSPQTISAKFTCWQRHWHGEVTQNKIRFYIPI